MADAPKEKPHDPWHGPRTLGEIWGDERWGRVARPKEPEPEPEPVQQADDAA